MSSYFTHEDRKKIVDLLLVSGWTRHPSHARGMRGIYVKHRAFFDVLRADGPVVSAQLRIHQNLATGASFPRGSGHGWHGRLVEALDAFAKRTTRNVPVETPDIIRKFAGERWPREPSSVPGFIKHVDCDAGRQHVLDYSSGLDGKIVMRCSETFCVYNSLAPEQLPALELRELDEASSA